MRCCRSFDDADIEGSTGDLTLAQQEMLNEWLESYEAKVSIHNVVILSRTEIAALQHDFLGKLTDWQPDRKSHQK